MEFYAHEPYFVFRIILTEFFHGHRKIIALTFLKIVEDFLLTVGIENLIDIIIDVYFIACVNYCFDLIEQFAEFQSFCLGNFGQRNFTVDSLDYENLKTRFVRNAANPQVFRAFDFIGLYMALDEFYEFFTITFAFPGPTPGIFCSSSMDTGYVVAIASREGS